MLNDFVDSEINQSYLDAMQADFDTLRKAGMKVVARFSYINDVLNEIPPWGDATKEQILEHLDQLKPILQVNSDVIALVEAGFIGVWGEWFFTDHFADPIEHNRISPGQYRDRGEVLAAILQALPPERMVAMRYPWQRQVMYGQKERDSLSSAMAHTGSDLARTGFHNDCFLLNDNDGLSYQLDDIEGDQAHLENDTSFVVVGGETCIDQNPSLRFNCETALKELARFHWSYINISHNPGLMDDGKRATCYDDITRTLGYRFELTRGTYADIVKPGTSFAVDIELKNVGFAAPFNPRLVELVLRHRDTGQLYSAPLPDDPRFWLPHHKETYSLNHEVCTPVDMPIGDYELLLNLPDPKPTLYGRPPYSIQLANEEVWEAHTGFNELHHSMKATDQVIGKDCAHDSLELAQKDTVEYRELPFVDLPLFLTRDGAISGEQDEVISGSYSIKGTYFGTGSYHQYLGSLPENLQFTPGHTYEVTFDFRILSTPDRGFETLFYSSKGGQMGDWLDSITIAGSAGDEGSVALTALLLNYPDYELVWNVIGTGAIAIDNIRLSDLTTGQTIVEEDVE